MQPIFCENDKASNVFLRENCKSSLGGIHEMDFPQMWPGPWAVLMKAFFVAVSESNSISSP